MKKLLFPILLFASGIYHSQSNRIIVEIDDSRRYIYESTLSKLAADSYKHEMADALKGHADRYFTELQKIADFFEPIDSKYKPLLNSEIENLKVYGYDILDLLKDLEKDQLTGTKLKYTVEKAFGELNSLSEKQSFKELTIYRAISNFKTDIYPTSTDETLFVMLQKESGMSENQVFDLYRANNDKEFRTFLIDEYEKAFFINHKYK